MAQHGKKYRDATRRFDREAFHGAVEAVELIRSLAAAGFDETIELVARLGVDPRKADQIVRGTVALLSGTGKDVRVAVFATGEQAAAAREAGADIVGSDDLAAQMLVADLDVSGGHVDDAFDRLLTLFPTQDADGKNAVRTRLLELFEVVGNDDPRVTAARRRLTMLLY